MNILVTGGAGYIGSHCVYRLLEKGNRVFVIDNLSTGNKWAIHPDAQFIELDLGDFEKLEELFRKEGFDAILHFAASTDVGESVLDPLKYYKNNFSNSLNLIELSKKYSIKNFIFSSTAAVYGNANNHKVVTENSAIHPVSPYGIAKSMVEQLLFDLKKAKDNFNFVCLRYFNVAGSSTKYPIGQATPHATHLVKVCSEVAVGKREKLKIFGTDYPTQDGTCIRDYIHVDDLVEAHILALEYIKLNKKSDVFNCGYQKGYSVLDVVKTMEKVSGKKINVELAPRREGDLVEIIADNKKIKNILGWKPKYDNLDIICKSAYDWELKLKNR